MSDELDDILEERTGARGEQVLRDVENFLTRFVAYPSEAAKVAHVLWVAHTHLMPRWESTPRIAFLSPEPGSGKSRALEATGSLVPNAVHAVNVSPAYLFRKMAEEVTPTILYDEIDTVFGQRSSERTEEIRGLLNAGHRKGATAGRCEMQGKTIVTVDYPAYSAVALAGLNDVPDTVASRAVLVRMRRRGPGERVEQWRARIHEPQGQALRDELADWAARFPPEYPLDSDFPDMPEGIEDRAADVWEALLMVADAAGGQWPERARVAAVALVAAARDNERTTLGVQLLRDLRTVFDDQGAEVLDTETILAALNGMEASPWGGFNGRGMDARDLARLTRKYTDVEGKPIAPRSVRLPDGRTPKGYQRGSFHDAWLRYLPSLPPTSATSATTATPTATLATPVAAVAEPMTKTTTCEPITCGNANCIAFGTCVR